MINGLKIQKYKKKIYHEKYNMKKRCIIRYKGFPQYSKLKKLSETKKQRISEAKKNVKHLVESISTKINVMVYQRHLLTVFIFTQNHVIRSSLLLWLVKQVISILLSKEDHLVGLLGKHLLLGPIPISVTSPKKGEYNIMGTKLAQQ